jgi:hypothetical protein
MPRQPAKHQRAAAKMTWFECDQPGCTYKTKYNRSLKRHISYIHNVGGIKWHYCDQPGCNYKAKQYSDLKQHNANIHNIGVVTWYSCNQKNCSYKSKYNKRLKEHKSYKHNINVKLYYCNQPNCSYQAKRRADIKQHQSNIHNIDIKWYYCGQPGCDYKTKQISAIRPHKASMHNINVQLHYCDQEKCTFITKKGYNLKKHKEMVHDIGEHECQICLKNRNSRNKYVDNQGSHMICNNCYYKVTGKKTRKEKIWSDYLDQHLECPAVASDKSLKSIGGCILERPDKLYTDISYTEIGECDEYEHLHHNGDYTCDEQRISKIYDQEGIIGTFMNVLRWNPDKYTVPLQYQRKTQKERLEIYVALAKKLREKANNNEFRDRIHIYYLFYSEDNPLIAKNIPYTMIYSMDDVMTKV